MESSTLVSVEEYLRSSYHPDCHYVEGRIVERQMGEREHSLSQKSLIVLLTTLEQQLRIVVFPEQRVQVRADRYRVPDLCVVAGDDPREPILTRPPFLCIEIVSKDDRLIEVQDVIDDYLQFGVRYVWIVDPRKRRAWVHTTEVAREVRDGVLRTANPEIALALDSVFSAL
jgi:Uma2 family endonuclease